MKERDEFSPIEQVQISLGNPNMTYLDESGRFKCPFPNCNKSFTRQEHLSRHKLNHWPKEIFRCSYVFPDSGLSCDRTFVRKDLLARHEKRHKRRGGRLSNHSSAVPNTIEGRDDLQMDDAMPQGISVVPQTNITQSLHENNTSAIQMQPSLLQNSYPNGMYRAPIGAKAPEDATTLSGTNVQQQPSNETVGMSERTGSENANKLFNCLYDASGSQKQVRSHYPSANKTNYPVVVPPQRTSSNLQDYTIGQISNSRNALFDVNVSEERNERGSKRSTSPTAVQSSMADVRNSVSHTLTPSESNFTFMGGNQMHDLFSLDFLNIDPLDALMQELSAPSMETQNSSGPELTPKSQQEVSTRAEVKCRDDHSADVKDNFETQRSNVLELQKQNPDSQKSPSKWDSNISKRSLNYKKKVRSTMTPTFFHADPKTKYHVSTQKCQELFDLVPGLQGVSTSFLKRSLLSFWCNFHPQYGLLHKPSFHVDEQPSILVLALIMVGASLLGSDYRRTISDIICIPLRWIIFSNEDFQPPSKTYIIQSLLLLECYEKTSTNRYLHERSYLHHGTTIQLLRRTPSLGGHPLRLKSEENPGETQDPQEVYRRWIDCEMLKRVALYAFYMDTTHAAVFGYANIFINCNQVQLMLPCSDLAWESYDLSYQTLLDFGFGKERTTFLSGLKQLLSEVTETLQIAAREQFCDFSNVCIKSWDIKSVLGRKVLLAGIISTLFQCQESNGDSLTSIARGCLCDEEHSDISWQDILSFTLNYWLLKIQKSYKSPTHCFIATADSTEDIECADEDLANTNILSLDGRSCCKIPEYYMAQVMLRIFHHDYYIFGGAPWRMNVKTGDEEYSLASSHILQFASDPNAGGVSLVYAYQFMFEMFIDEKTLKVNLDSYNPNSDYIITRPNTLALLTLLIWCCSFVLYGPEVELWDNAKENSEDLTLAGDNSNNVEQNSLLKETYIPKESFEDHLRKMYYYLKIDPTTDIIAFQNCVKEKASLLEGIKGRNNLCGIMKHMRNIYAESYWDLGREFSRLFDNCLERSLGKDSPTCENMYKV